MNYNILILRRAQKELAGLHEPIYSKTKFAIQKLGDDPRPRGSRKLSGRDGWRVRVGEHRVIYEIDNSNHSVTILHIGRRRDVYRSE
jgi:mRNA interferase RelE/StbE